MSMTQEEAIERYEGIRYTVACFTGSKKDCDAVDMAFSALRPVSREQVEKVWRGEWIGDNDERVGTIDGSPTESATCSVCGNWLVGSDEYDCSGHFCPACGRAMTDEAVDMMLEMWKEALDENT